MLGNISSHKEQCCSGTAAQGGGGVTIPGGVPEPWGCGTEGCGQWVWWGGLGLDLVILEVFSNLNGSMISVPFSCGHNVIKAKKMLTSPGRL